MKKKQPFRSRPASPPFANSQPQPKQKFAPPLPPELAAEFNQALTLHRAGRLDEAAAIYQKILKVHRKHFDCLHLLGVIHHQRGDNAEAVRQINAALELNANSSAAYSNLGNALKGLKRLEEALTNYELALALNPDNAEALYNRGVVLQELKRYDDALASYDRALAVRPDYASALNNSGAILHALGRLEQSLASFDRALAVQPGHAEAWNNRGNILREIQRFEAAQASYEQALTINPNYADAHNNLGNLFTDLKKFEQALASFDRALAINPKSAEVLHNRGKALFDLNRYEEAFACYDQAFSAAPHLNCLAGQRLYVKMYLCDWSNFEAECASLVAAVDNGELASTPGAIISVPSTAATHLQCARRYTEYKLSTPFQPLWNGERYAHDRIRLAYISADFREHPVANLLANMFEQHDRSRFETIAIALGPDDQSGMRFRLKDAFERFIEVNDMSDAEVARLMRDLEVDIAVDLMGYTAGYRCAILAHRAAPIQVNYLSYPGIVGSKFIDYIIADKVVIPEHQRALFSEPIIDLPDTYLTYDATRKISERTPSRAELGLPEKGFVFCAYNTSYKNTPQMFDIWMRLLRAVEGGVLWMSGANATTMSNLRKEARARGVDPGRLIFAPYARRVEEHLARYRAADLFLDTVPFNAQTTACDALWAGLPVLTRLGETFVGRVAASVLGAIGLPELITRSADEYEALALKLAREPALLAEIKSKLARNRETHALFDGVRFTRNIEAAYTTMWEQWRRGERPQGFRAVSAAATSMVKQQPPRQDRPAQAGKLSEISQLMEQALSSHQRGDLTQAEILYRQILDLNPAHFDALHMLAVAQSSLGHKDEALTTFDRAMAIRPNHPGLLYNRGITLQELKRYDEGLASYDKALAGQPDHVEALNNRGVVLKELRRLEEAVASYEQAIVLRPGHAEALNNRGNALKELKRYPEALASYEQALEVKPNDAETINNCGLALFDMQRHADAIRRFEAAIAVRPNYAEAMCNRGMSLKELHRYDEALGSLEQAISVRPNYLMAQILRGNVLMELKQYEEALICLDGVLANLPSHAGILINRGNVLKELQRHDEALEVYGQALEASPDYLEALNNRATAYQDLKRLDEALADYDRALAVCPDAAEVLYNRGTVCFDLKRYGEALDSYTRALALKPHLKYLLGQRFNVKKFLCDWSDYDDDCAKLIAGIEDGRRVASPFVMLSAPSTLSHHLKCAKIYTDDKFSAADEPIWQGERYAHDRIRIAYISADFRNHPIAHLLAGVFEHHDRKRFETIALAIGADDGSEMRERLKQTFEQFIYIDDKNDLEVAQMMRELEVDIAIDLMGFTASARSRILSYRGAPIQVNYLSYPGITGTNCIDYILADRFVIPEEHRKQFSESIVYLPDTYLPYDTTRMISDRTPSRTELGLPDKGFVFSAYNNSYKITPQVFDIWMRLLHAVEGSVLWLTSTSEATEKNLRREAQARGVDPARLVFAPFVDRVADHLARYRAADLFLDTLPFNAQTTACDALWAGLPVVTRLGETFVGRVAASLLTAVGLPELITHSAEEYEALALKLAREPAMLAGLNAKLERHRDSYPLFDIARFTRNIESAYTTMWKTWQRGEERKSFSVEADDQSTMLPRSYGALRHQLDPSTLGWIG